MSTLPNLQPALKLYSSDKVRDRAQGAEQIREIFSNKENLQIFQETASRDAGAGWIAFFQCLFQVVVTEKKGALKGNATAQADRRLGEAISLVRWMTERSLHNLSRKPFQTIFNHLLHLLVHGRQVFQPASLDYAKALRALLSYPPHLEHLDVGSWRTLMGVCLGAVLGEAISLDDTWEDGMELDELNDESVEVDEKPFSRRAGAGGGGGVISQSTNELVSLIPILLSSTSSPLLSPLPDNNEMEYTYKPSYSLHLINKFVKFFNLHPTETSAHLPVLRSLNMVLGNLELNCRGDFVEGGKKVWARLVGLWASRNKGVRELVVVALRMIMPWIGGVGVGAGKGGKVEEEVREGMERLMECMGKEAGVRWGAVPLDMGCLRLKFEDAQVKKGMRGPYSTRVFCPGFDFTHEAALNWAIYELYAEVCYTLYTTFADRRAAASASTPATPTAKRRKVNDPLTSLIRNLEMGTSTSRLIALQVLHFLVDRHWEDLHGEARKDIRRVLIELLDDDDTAIQTWALLGLASLATLHQEVKQDQSVIDNSPWNATTRQSEDHDWHRIWTYAIRKTSQAGTSRAACHTANAILKYNILPTSFTIGDIDNALRTVEIQGPPYPYDSVCAFLTSMLQAARSDVRLYASKLEDQVVAWLTRWNALEGMRGKGRMDATTPGDILGLLNEVCRFKHIPIHTITVEEVLPDCAIVDRVLEECRLAPIRQWLLHGIITENHVDKETRSKRVDTGSVSLGFLEGAPKRICRILMDNLTAFVDDWSILPTNDGTKKSSESPPDRIRRSIDMIVLGLSFQASLEVNGIQPDSSVIQQCLQLLRLIRSSLTSAAYNTTALHLIWRGLYPLVRCDTGSASEVWPILLRPDVQSGIRQDLLGPNKYGLYSEGGDGGDEGGMTKMEVFLTVLWRLQDVGSAFKDICDDALRLVERSAPQSAHLSNTQMPTQVALEDDDFGEIRNADTDAMPLSKEALECQRTTSSLGDTLIRFRLRTSMLTSPIRLASKDSALINAFLASEGARFAQIGTIVCNAIKDELLRLSPDAVDLILETIAEMLSSYAYTKDENLLCVVLSFVTSSLPVWLSAENGGGNGDIGTRCLEVIKVLVDRSTRGLLASWRVRLGLIIFFDEYLDYDPPMAVWRRFLVDVGIDDIRDEENEIKPIKVITTSLRDLDIRVRMRAATSSAGIFYLTSIQTNDFLNFYTSIVTAEPRTAEHWDSIITDILFKLNCCVTSAHLRATAIYHLYEIATAGTSCHGHLQSGLETVSTRLGLRGIAELFMPYSPVIVKSMISTGQPPMRIPHRLFGYATRKAQAAALLEYTGATILAAAVGEAAFPRVDSLRGAKAEFAGLCKAAGVGLGEAMIHHLTGAAAVVLGCKVDEMIEVPISHEEAVGALLSLPGLPPADTALGLLTDLADAVIAHLFTSVDSAATIVEILELLPKSARGVFEEISTTDDELVITTPALQPCANLKDVLSAYKYILKRFSTLSIPKMVFGAISRLFYLVNDAFLVCEQLRHLKSISIMAALHAKEFGNPTILGMFLRESIALISKIGTFDPAFSMVRWGFERVLQVGVVGIGDMVSRLGIARESLTSQGGLCEGKGDELEGWIAQQVPRWIRVEAMAMALDAAKVFWPESLARHLTGWPEPSFWRLTDMVRMSNKDSLAISKRMVKAIRDGDSTVDLSVFREDMFWHLKKALNNGFEGDGEGMKAFLDLLFYADGDIHAPNIAATVELVFDGDLSALKVAAGTGSRSTSAADRSITPVMAAITEKIVRLTTDDHFRLRERAFRVLRGIIPAVENIRSTKMLKPATLDLLPLLSASSSPKYVKTAQDKLQVLAPGEGDEWVRKGRDYRTWTAALGHLLCTTANDTTGFFTALLPLLQSDSTTPPGILPLLVQSSLTLLEPKVPLVDDTRRHIRTLSSYFTRLLEDKATSLEVVKAVIHIMVHLRHYLPPYRIDSLGYENWLSVDPMLLSRMSAKCGEYNTALMFLELAGPGRVGKTGVELTNEEVQNVMYEIYSNVEDPDGFYGIKTRDTSKALSRQLQHEGEHWRSLGLNSAAIQGRGSTSIIPAMRDLHHLGFDRMASAVFGSLQTASSTGSKQLAADPLFFELAWRTGDWDLPTSNVPNPESGELFYTVLRAVHRERDFEAARKVVGHAIGVEVGRLRELGLERMAQIKERTGRLLCLREVDNWLRTDTQRALQGGEGKGHVMRMFADLDNSFSFGNAENILATRRSLITSAKERESRNTFGDLSTPAMDSLISLEKSCLLRLGEMARQDGNLQASINAITAVKELEYGGTASVEALDEFGHVLWAMQEHSLALRDAEQQVEDFRSTKSGDRKRLAVLLGRIATWTATAKLRAADGIKQTFEEALTLSKSMALSTVELARCCHDYAIFADAHQNELSRSPELERLRSATRQSNRSIASFTSSKKRQSTSKSATNIEVDFQEDQLARQKMEDAQAAYVKIALKMFAAALSMSNEHDDSVTRMCALWLEQGKNHSEFEVSMSKERKEEIDQETSRRESICQEFAGPVSKIPSYKFIFLGPQLAARLDKHREAFNGSLNDLILRLSRQHPFHILYQIIPLAGGAITVPAKSRRASDIKADDTDHGAVGRAEAADHILKALSADTANVLAKIAAQQMKMFAEAATTWSLSRDKVEDSATSDKPLQVPPNCPLKGLVSLKIPIATCPPAVDLTGKYEGIPTLLRYSRNYTILGGIHKPKKMAVYNTLNQIYIQIFKGDDEVRQDAVMEQVFEMSNKLLSRDRKTKARDLRFRTYVVIPLAKKTGVLEFVGDSQGIGDWLKPSHSRYGKLHDDHPAESFRKTLKPLQDDESTWPDLKGEYEKLMLKFHPVMRYFFHEKHRDAMAWFGMRLNYARSVAVTSVVGWVLGIGDRHCSNILIDTKSGELVHIDFGIVFEEGRRLRIPEKVPFRLTNDIVDGLGITGVDGTFRRCSEHTLRVLRESSELIMTVLEVFKHDPLYAWTGDPDKLQRAQGGGRIHDLAMATGQEKADRILSRIRQKLRGDLSVEYTVNQLIMEARDTESLAGIFTGWQAWF